MRSTGQVGPVCTVPRIPVPGCEAGVPQAAIVRATANDTMRDVTGASMITTLQPLKSSARSVAPHARGWVPQRVDRLLGHLICYGRSVTWIDHDGGPDRNPGKEDSDRGQRNMDAAVTRVPPGLGSGPHGGLRLPAGIVQPFAVARKPHDHLDRRVRIPLGRSPGPGRLHGPGRILA